MRKLFLLPLFFCLLTVATHAQDKKDTATAAVDTLKPYQKYPTLPAFNIIGMDSVTIFNTYNIPEGGPIAIFFFSPDCSHCRRTTARIVEGMEQLKDVRFYMITPVHNMVELRKFYDEYHLGDYKNIKMVGRDNEFFFGSFYGIKFVPDMALYDGHKKLIKLIQGETTADIIYNVLHEQK